MQVTTEAKRMLAEIRRPEGQVLRLEPTSPEKLGLVPGDAQQDDLVVEDQGSDLLHVPAALTPKLDHAVIDRVETAEGPRFSISADNAAGSNGTGS